MHKSLHELIYAAGRVFAHADKPEFKELLEQGNIDYAEFVKALTDLSNAVLKSKYRGYRRDHVRSN